MKEKIKKYLLFLLISVIFFLFLPLSYLRANTLSCWDVDGMSIFGYDYNEYIYIGSIANEFSSDSIANEFGWGNEFKSKSIMNEFGSFGNKFSSYSAFNDFASSPPIIINRDNKFVGYLTVNSAKNPSINTYKAIKCAKDSFSSPIHDHEDMVFPRIPGSSSVSDSQTDIENLIKSLCPVNSQYLNGSCTCNEGYVVEGNVCITYTQNCQLKFGINSYGDKNYCYCNVGYELNSTKTSCVKSVVCPLNSTKINNICVCNNGYVMKNNACITYTEDCIQNFGNNVYGMKGLNNNSSCYCNSGYKWNTNKTTCIKIEAPQTVENNQNILEQQKVSTTTDKEQIQKEEIQKNDISPSKEGDKNIAKEERSGFIKSFSNFLANVSSAFGNFFRKIFR